MKKQRVSFFLLTMTYLMMMSHHFIPHHHHHHFNEPTSHHHHNEADKHDRAHSHTASSNHHHYPNEHSEEENGLFSHAEHPDFIPTKNQRIISSGSFESGTHFIQLLQASNWIHILTFVVCEEYEPPPELKIQDLFIFSLFGLRAPPALFS